VNGTNPIFVRKHYLDPADLVIKNGFKITEGGSMMIKFSATISYQYDTPFSPFCAADYEKGLDWLRSGGFDAAEICISHYEGVDVGKIKQGLDQRGLGCSTISTGQARTLEGITLIDDDPAVRRKAQRRVEEHIAAAHVLGSQVTIGLLRGLGTTGRASEQQKRLVETLAPCVALAREKKVTLLLEAINRYETALLNSAAATLEMITALGNPEAVGILWDVFHANIEDADFAAAVALMGPKLRHVHFADSNRYFPGYGHLDFSFIYDQLQKTGFDGYISFECMNLPSARTVIDEAPAFIAKLRARRPGRPG
jgi:sugar phosphate isomerase/epimerase